MLYLVPSKLILRFLSFIMFLTSYASLAEDSSSASIQPTSLTDSDDQEWSEQWEETWADDDEPTSAWQLNSLVEAGVGKFIHENNTISSFSIKELRAQVEATYVNGNFSLNAKTQLRIDEVVETSKLTAREFNVVYQVLPNTTFITGRQIITWGTGDYIFLNDLFAKDWQSFFSGREDEHLKAPNDAFRILHYINGYTIDAVYSPKFTPDNYLTGERFSFYSPSENSLIAPETFFIEQTNKSEYALRIANNTNNVEYAIYLYKGMWPTPQGIKLQAGNNNKAYFPALNSFGASIRTPALSGLFNAEAAIYNSVEDSTGSNPLIANGQIRLLFGYEQEISTNFTGAIQTYIEHTKDYNNLKASYPYPDTIVDRNRQVFTLRLTHLALQQSLSTHLFLFYSPTDEDTYVKTSIDYRYSDHWRFSLGANVFTGEKKHTVFGQHKDNSNLWFRFKYHF